MERTLDPELGPILAKIRKGVSLNEGPNDDGKDFYDFSVSNFVLFEDNSISNKQGNSTDHDQDSYGADGDLTDKQVSSTDYDQDNYGDYGDYLDEQGDSTIYYQDSHFNFSNYFDEYYNLYQDYSENIELWNNKARSRLLMDQIPYEGYYKVPYIGVENLVTKLIALHKVTGNETV